MHWPKLLMYTTGTTISRTILSNKPAGILSLKKSYRGYATSCLAGHRFAGFHLLIGVKKTIGYVTFSIA